MRKVLKILTFTFLLIAMLSYNSQAEGIDTIMDKFYNGLADIIERNMDNPDQCVSEVDDYYIENRETIEKIHKMIEEGMAQAKSMMGEYKTYEPTEYGVMSDEEIEALESQAEQRGMTKPATSTEPEVDRYARALEAFLIKYPTHGLKITMKAMQFIPGTKMEE